MKEAWDVIQIVFDIIGWDLTGIISIGVFNVLWEPSFNLINLNKTTVKLLVLALLGPILLSLVIAYILFTLAILSFHREWDVASEFIECILLGFNETPRQNKRIIDEE